jgi:hypothetical protein
VDGATGHRDGLVADPLGVEEGQEAALRSVTFSAVPWMTNASISVPSRSNRRSITFASRSRPRYASFTKRVATTRPNAGNAAMAGPASFTGPSAARSSSTATVRLPSSLKALICR